MMNEKSTEIRVAIVIPQQGLLLSPDFEKPRSFSGMTQQSETREGAAHRIAAQEKYGLPRMRTLLALGALGDSVGYALEPAHVDDVDLRQFTVRGFDQDELLEHIEAHPDYLDPIDAEFIRRAIMGRPRG